MLLWRRRFPRDFKPSVVVSPSSVVETPETRRRCPRSSRPKRLPANAFVGIAPEPSQTEGATALVPKAKHARSLTRIDNPTRGHRARRVFGHGSAWARGSAWEAS